MCLGDILCILSVALAYMFFEDLSLPNDLLMSFMFQGKKTFEGLMEICVLSLDSVVKRHTLPWNYQV